MKIVLAACATSLLFIAMSSGGRAIRPGHWGGQNISLDIKGFETSIEFVCATGAITERFAINRRGRFDLSGVYIQGQPGPSEIGDGSGFHPAQYIGDIDRNVMHLTIVLTDTGQTIGPFLLIRGDDPYFAACA